MILDHDLVNGLGIEKYSVIEKFYSKKNDVYKIKNIYKNNKEEICVIKNFNNIDNMNREIDMLKNLKNKGLAVPEIYYVGKKEVVMEYIEGKTLLDVICENEINKVFDYDIVRKLLIWLKNFYSITRNSMNKKIIMSDVNLRNFIVDKHIYGIDFENCKKGNIEEDIGKLCAYILTYDPSFTEWKVKLVDKIFCESMSTF